MTIRHNRIENNYAYAKGGGIALFDLSGSDIFNNLIADNETGTGGGIYIQNSPGTSIINCTIASNSASLIVGGICTYQFSYPQIQNSIVYQNTATEFVSLLSAFDDSFDVSYSDIEGGWEGIEVMDVIPIFASGLYGNYYLSQIASGQTIQSPVVDQGGSSAAIIHLDTMTTRTDQIGDIDIVDQGFHYYRNPSSGWHPSTTPVVIPSSITLSSFPNPFNTTAIIEFSLPTTCAVELSIYDILGRKTTSLIQNTYPSGNHRVFWHGNDVSGNPVATGSYFLTLTTPLAIQSKHIILLK